MKDFSAELEVIDGTTVVTAHGLATVANLVGIAGCGFYGLTRRSIWDMRQADMRNFRHNELEELSAAMKAGQHRRMTEWVGIVAKDQKDLVQLRYFTLVAAHQVGQRARHFLTCDMDDVWAWLATVESPHAPDSGDLGLPMGPGG